MLVVVLVGMPATFIGLAVYNSTHAVGTTAGVPVPAGLPFTASAKGFRPGAEVSFQVVCPDGALTFHVRTAADGSAVRVFDGLWDRFRGGGCSLRACGPARRDASVSLSTSGA